MRVIEERHFQKALFLIQKGQTDEALKELERADDTVNILLKDPENEFFQTNLQMNFNNALTLGDIFYIKGRFPQAKDFYELSLLISKKLLEKGSENLTYQKNVATAINNLGVLLWSMGRFEESKERYEKALEMREKILEKDPQNLIYQTNAATTYNNFGNLLYKLGLFEETKRYYEKALEIYEKLLETNSANVMYQSYVGSTLNNLGFLLGDIGRIEESKERYEKALGIYEKLLGSDPKNMSYQSQVAMTLNNLGNLTWKMVGSKESKLNFEFYGELSELWKMELIIAAKQSYEKALEIYENLLKTDPGNVLYQSDVGMTLNNLGALFNDIGNSEEAKQRYEKSLEIYENLLKTDPENVQYQTDVGMVLNNLGALLKKMGLLENAKIRYERALEIYTEPLQRITIIKKSKAIIKLIELNKEQAERETNSYDQIKHFKEVYHLCKKNQEFFSKYGLKHEKNLVMEAGFSAYVDYIIKNIRCEKDPKKRAVGYEEAIKAIEKMSKIGNEEEVSKMVSSSICYLKGRKLVNESLGSEQPDLELIKEAANQFRNAKETFKRANVCYCIYTGLLNVLENVAIFEDENGKKAKKLIQQIIETFPEKIDPSIKASFEEITKIFDERDVKSRRKHLEKFDGKIRAIEYKALENLFGHVQKKLKDYIEEPFSPNLFYSNWKLRIAFDAERITGKLKVKTGNTILFDRALNKDEIKNNAIEIDYLDKKYIPCGEDVIIFETPNQKPVVRDTDYLETISKNKKVRIFCHNCCNDVCTGGDLRIAVVQLRYDVYGEDYAVKILASDDYKRKVMAVLEAVQEEVDFVVFPEFSIPFEYLEDIQRYSNENGIIVLAGTHYVTEEYLEKYEKLFASDFLEEDFRKNICPVVIPNSRIIHNEKMFGAKEERDLFFHKGVKQGKMNHIFKLRDNLNLGVMICFEFLNDELRQRLISTCDLILVPQTNPNPKRFYDTALNDINNPLCAGNKAYLMANGIFRIGKMENNEFVLEKKEILGGSTGVLLTLDKESNKRQDEGIISHIEQFILMATISAQFSTSRDLQIAPEPIKTSLIHIFEENEILLTRKEDADDFLTLIRDISACTGRNELKNLIEMNRSLIVEYSPLMHEGTKALNNLDFEEIKEKCRYIMIPAK